MNKIKWGIVRGLDRLGNKSISDFGNQGIFLLKFLVGLKIT